MLAASDTPLAPRPSSSPAAAAHDHSSTATTSSSSSSSGSSPREELWTSLPGSPRFTAAPHQIAGHLFERGKIGSLVCDDGYFYKPLQRGPRGVRERGFYENLKDLPDDDSCENEESTSLLSDLSAFVPAFFGVVELGDITYMKLEDVTRRYARPSIIDIKIGYQTWYPRETDTHIEKCQVKDKATTTSELGFKICGMQVYDTETENFWRATKEWCKALDAESVKTSLARFLNPSSPGLTAGDLCLGASGLVEEISKLERWCERQRRFHFYSASLLVLYEGSATSAEDLKLRCKLIDFAHAHGAHTRDDNFISGLSSLRATISGLAQPKD